MGQWGFPFDDFNPLRQVVREDAQATNAVVERVNCMPIACEGIIAEKVGDKRTLITNAMSLATTFREPRLNDVKRPKEQTRTLEYAEIPNMSEPLIIGCPVWDRWDIFSRIDELEIGALGITIPTIGPGDFSSESLSMLRLTNEVLLDGSENLLELNCSFNLSSS